MNRDNLSSQFGVSAARFYEKPAISRILPHPAHFIFPAQAGPCKAQLQEAGRGRVDFHLPGIPNPRASRAERLFFDSGLTDLLDRQVLPFDCQPSFALALGRCFEHGPGSDRVFFHEAKIEVRPPGGVPVNKKSGHACPCG